MGLVEEENTDGGSMRFGAPGEYAPDEQSGVGGNVDIPSLITAIQSQQAEMQGLPDRITSAISGMTITATVNQGNVQLDGSTVGRLVGSYVNIQFGQQARLSGRGNA